MIRLELTEAEAGLVEAMALREQLLNYKNHAMRARDAHEAQEAGHVFAAERWRGFARDHCGLGEIVGGLLEKLRQAGEDHADTEAAREDLAEAAEQGTRPLADVKAELGLR